MSEQIESLRLNIKKLKPNGDDGFEGLVAAVLSNLTKRSFAIASSGAQHGRDGQSAMDGGAIVFEAKLYEDTVPKDKVYTKIFEIAADKSCVTELYIVAATGPISTQHITTMREGAQRLAIALMVLAWPKTGLADLAILLAMTPAVSAKFIAEQTGVKECELINQLSAVRTHSLFQAQSEDILRTLLQPSIAPAFALVGNEAWLSEAFSDKKRARSVFGQALSPMDTSTPGTVDRTHLKVKVTTTVFGKPDGAITAILGADGNGKSWIFAQAWSNQANRPLTLVIVPEDINALPSLESCEELLLSKLITQTGEAPRPEAVERWRRHFERWKNEPDAATPRLIVFMDGINQRESVNWLRFLDTMSSVVAHLGGRLVFSCRQLFYCDNLEDKLISRVVTIQIPEWTDSELEALLQERGSSIAILDAGIVRSLRNPRIFGIAASLFKTEKITEFGELSVSRLLFEHIRSGSAAPGTTMSFKQFTAGICTHAENIVQRTKQRQSDGLNEFDISGLMGTAYSNQTISEQFVITSAGRFFEVINENPNKYVLKDEGLPLALGLALVRTAQEALRKSRSVVDALSNILDPIAALDRTCDILLGAILSAVLEGASQEVVVPLIRSFVTLQNLDSTRYPEFRNLFGRDPCAFLAALEDSALSRDVTPNLSWLTDAIKELRDSESFELALTTFIHRWLNVYSLAPKRMVLLPNDQEHAAERDRKLGERQQQLSLAIASMSQVENALLSGMVQQERGDYNQLNLLAFQALAGRPLALFSKSLRNWCFAASLNGGYHHHQSDFSSLLHFNLVDWIATRDALREAAKLLRQPRISRVGQWALVKLLRVTGDSDDAKEADSIADELTKDREYTKGWRRIEDYCATDPCDPASIEPDNIDKTASIYRTINPAELRRSMGYTQGDYFFTAAQPGLARFRPKVAVEVLRALADQALTREFPEFRQAVFLLEDHTVGLEERIAKPYVDRARLIAQMALDANEDKNNEAWLAAQFALSVAFPHMTGDAQFDALVDHPRDKTVLLDLCHVFRPISQSKLEDALSKAMQEGRHTAQFRILSFAEYSRTSLTERSKAMVLQLLTSTDSHVRLSALALIHAAADAFLLEGLVNSGWNAAVLDSVSDKVEILHGSQALVLAAQQGFLPIEMSLERIALSAYETLTKRLGSEAAIAIGSRLDTALQKASVFQINGNLPNIEQSFEGHYRSVVYEISENPSQNEAPDEQWRRLDETGDAWYERQKQNQKAANHFERDLTEAGAQLIMQSVTTGLIEAIDNEVPALVNSWSAFFLQLDRKPLNNVHNFALVVAEVISRRDVATSLKLFEQLRTSSPCVRVTFGQSKISLDATTAWGAADSNEMKEVRFARLDRISNDHDLAMEVLAAIRAERLNVLRDYVIDRRHRPEPAHRARAAMVAGLSPDETWALETIAMLEGEHGFLQGAYEGAMYAMERHQWSCHWASQMRTATDPVDLWRYAVLLSKIVDGRFVDADVQGETPSPLIERFGTTLNGPIRHRIQKWKSKRDSKLFGMNVPDKIYLSTEDYVQ